MSIQPDTSALPLARWSALYRALCSTGDPQPAFDTIVQAYNEPHRHYHAAAHIAACLALFDSAQTLFARPGEVEWAIWLHDVVYDTHAHDNEERSALLSAEILRAGAAQPGVINRVSELILATRHREIPAGNDARLFVDIDLSVLGSAPDVFDEYERAIRLEYAWVPEALYREKRAEILEGFLAREDVYFTDIFQQRFQEQARANLRRSVARLRSQSV